jgi:hypothetical protein
MVPAIHIFATQQDVDARIRAAFAGMTGVM